VPLPTIYYIRHGETEWNAAGRFQGWRDVPLNERGRAQATQAGEILRGLLTRDQHDIAALPFIASPLGRARETMELLRTALGTTREGYALDERLREISYGDWEGMTLSEMEAAHPKIFAARNADKWRVAAPGGESYFDLAARVREWLASLKGESVVVAHGGTLRALMTVIGTDLPASAVEQYIEQGVVYVFKDGQLEKYT
jgi:broad specificity phosphatase PhoE